MSQPLIICLAFEALRGGSSEPETVRVATAGYNHPSAPGYFSGRLASTITFRRDLWAQGTLSGVVDTGWGDAEILDGDHQYRWLLDAAVSGRPFTVWIGEGGADWSTFTILFKGVTAGVAGDLDAVTVKLRDRMEALDSYFVSDLYGGANVGGVGLDGTVEDLEGERKLAPLGLARNLSPKEVNTGQQIWQFSGFSQVADLVDLFDNGVALTREAPDYATEADVQDDAQAPAGGAYKVMPRLFDGSSWGGGYVRLGAIEDGPITCDIAAGSASERTAGGVILAACSGIIETGDVIDADFAALDVAAGYELGILATDKKRKEVLSLAAVSVGAAVWFDRLSRLRARQMVPPNAEAATVHLTDTPTRDRTKDIKVIAWDLTSAGDYAGTPPSFIRLAWGPNFTVQEKAAGLADQHRAAWAKKEFREKVIDTGASTLWPLAEELSWESYLANAADANAVAAHLANLVGGLRQRAKATVEWSPTSATSLDLGGAVLCSSSGLGWTSRPMLITAIEIDGFGADVEVWG
jgi:hypothetical protein